MRFSLLVGALLLHGARSFVTPARRLAAPSGRRRHDEALQIQKTSRREATLRAAPRAAPAEKRRDTELRAASGVAAAEKRSAAR